MKFSIIVFFSKCNKFAWKCGFGHINWRNPYWKTSFFVQCLVHRKVNILKFVLEQNYGNLLRKTFIDKTQSHFQFHAKCDTVPFHAKLADHQVITFNVVPGSSMSIWGNIFAFILFFQGVELDEERGKRSSWYEQPDSRLNWREKNH